MAKSPKQLARKARPAGSATPIVSAEDLVPADGWELSEFEYGLVIVNNAFHRWMQRCMAATGHRDFGPLDVLVLHNVNHRQRAKRLGDICFHLNIEDQHTVSYALKKLLKAKLIEGEKRSKETFYRTTAEGAKVCRRYRAVREQCLLSAFQNLKDDPKEIRAIATRMRILSGLYDQAARAASSF